MALCRFPGASSMLGLLLKTNYCSVEQAIIYLLLTGVSKQELLYS